MLQRGNSGDGCELASTSCKYDLRKGKVKKERKKNENLTAHQRIF